jgi:hypothetical protein
LIIFKLISALFQIEYNDRAKSSPLKEHKPINVTKPAAAAQDDDEDDVDIDAI